MKNFVNVIKPYIYLCQFFNPLSFHKHCDWWRYYCVCIEVQGAWDVLQHKTILLWHVGMYCPRCPISFLSPPISYVCLDGSVDESMLYAWGGGIPSLLLSLFFFRHVVGVCMNQVLTLKVFWAPLVAQTMCLLVQLAALKNSLGGGGTAWVHLCCFSFA